MLPWRLGLKGGGVLQVQLGARTNTFSNLCQTLLNLTSPSVFISKPQGCLGAAYFDLFHVP